MEYVVERYRREEIVVHTDSPQEALMCATVSDAKDYRILEPHVTQVVQMRGDYNTEATIVVIMIATCLGYAFGYFCGQPSDSKSYKPVSKASSF